MKDNMDIQEFQEPTMEGALYYSQTQGRKGGGEAVGGQTTCKKHKKKII